MDSSNGNTPRTSSNFRDPFNTWLAFLKAEGKSQRTTDTYLWTVGQFVAFCEREDITPQTITVNHTAKYAEEVRGRPGRLKAPDGEDQKIGVWSYYGMLKDARNFLNWCHRNDLISRVVSIPVPKQPKQTVPRLRSQEQRENVLEMASTTFYPQRDRALVWILLETGLRNEEMRNLNWGDLFTNGEYGMPKVRVRNGKGGKDRTVPMPIEVHHALYFLKEDIKEELGPEFVADDAPIFQMPDGRRITVDAVRTIFARISRGVGFRVYPHMLRHTYGRTMVKRNVPLPAIQAWMGHSSIETTMIYAALDEDDGLDKIYLKMLNSI